MSGITPDGEHVSQSPGEADSSLGAVPAEAMPGKAGDAGNATPNFKSKDVRTHDFRQTSHLTNGEMRSIRARHDVFIRSAAAHLSSYLRLEVTIQISKIQTVTYQKFTGELSNPTHLTLFKVEPLKGVCLLEMTPRLSLTMVDRLLGGSAQSVNFTGELSEIETALLDHISQLVLNEWCLLWPKVANLRPTLLGHENNSRFLTSSPPDCVMLVVSLEVRLGDCTEKMELAFPFQTLEPVLQQIGPEANLEPDAITAKTQPKPSQWNPILDEVAVRINTELHGLELTVGALSRLKCGDVLMLDENCFERVEIRLEERPKFHGRLGTTGGCWAVELTENVER